MDCIHEGGYSPQWSNTPNTELALQGLTTVLIFCLASSPPVYFSSKLQVILVRVHDALFHVTGNTLGESSGGEKAAGIAAQLREGEPKVAE